MKENKNLTFRYALIQGTFWMNFAAILGFTSIYLLDKGFSNMQIGVLIAVAGLISAVLQPVVASYADRPQSPSLKKIVLALAAAVFTMGILLLLCQQSRVLTGLFYGGCITVLQMLTPLVNALGMETINQGKPLNFGISRGMGSAGYALLAYVLGLVVARTGPVAVPIAIFAGFAVLIAAVCFFPFEKTQGNASKEQKSSQGLLYFFKKYRRFCIVLAGCTLLYLSHTLLNSFTYQIVESKGGGSAQMGVSMALASLIELPTMFLFGYMVKKLRCDLWFRMSGIFFMLKTLGTLLAPNIPVFYGVQVFQLLGWALITVSSVYYVNAIMEPEDAIKGQAYITMTFTLGSVIGAPLGGALIDWAGVGRMLTWGTAAAAIGMVILLLATERTAKPDGIEK